MMSFNGFTQTCNVGGINVTATGTENYPSYSSPSTAPPSTVCTQIVTAFTGNGRGTGGLAGGFLTYTFVNQLLVPQFHAVQ